MIWLPTNASTWLWTKNEFISDICPTASEVTTTTYVYLDDQMVNGILGMVAKMLIKTLVSTIQFRYCIWTVLTLRCFQHMYLKENRGATVKEDQAI